MSCLLVRGFWLENSRLQAGNFIRRPRRRESKNILQPKSQNKRGKCGRKRSLKLAWPSSQV